MPKRVSGILAHVLLPTFPEMREWKAEEDDAVDAEKQKALTRPPARSQTRSNHAR